jgi:hypothetical protein
MWLAYTHRGLYSEWGLIFGGSNQSVVYPARCKCFHVVDCENNQFLKKWIMIIILNFHSGTKLSGWLRHCNQLTFYFSLGGEAANMMLDTFQNRPRITHNKEIFESLSPSEQQLCKRYVYSICYIIYACKRLSWKLIAYWHISLYITLCAYPRNVDVIVLYHIRLFNNYSPKERWLSVNKNRD